MQDSYLTCVAVASGNCEGRVEARTPLEGSSIQQWSIRCDWHQQEIEELQAEVNTLRTQRDKLLAKKQKRGG